MDYTKLLPKHIEKYIGENDLFLEVYDETEKSKGTVKRPPLLFVHGAYTGSWMWSRYIPHFVEQGWKCYAMNMRSHYRSRVLDLTQITFEDYLEDIKEVITECGETPILLGHSMGGILTQKLTETIGLKGMILIDSTISKEVYKIAPYDAADLDEFEEFITSSVLPAPKREATSIDESKEIVEFQKKYLTMESSRARYKFGAYRENGGISIDSSRVSWPSLTIKAVNCEGDDRRGKATAEFFKGEYSSFLNMSHTGLLVGERYKEVVDRIIKFLNTIMNN